LIISEFQIFANSDIYQTSDTNFITFYCMRVTMITMKTTIDSMNDDLTT